MENYNIISKESNIGHNVLFGRFCIVEDNVTIGDNVEIGDYSMILSGSSIGDNTKIGTHNKICHNVTIGKKCSFVSFCEIRENCQIGNSVSMGSRCTLSAGTIVEDQVVIKYNFVFTDTPDLTKNDKKIIGVLKNKCRLGANVTIMPGISIGINSEIGAWSQVRHNVPDNEIWYGNPAKYYRKVKHLGGEK
jgi:UDP-2-acetamido-3-amino-2,3-dideoxy-glucuronate N-acetyltransferase